MKEIWKVIDGYDGRYEVSNQGNVKSNYGVGRILKPAITSWNNHPIKALILNKNGKQKCCKVHRLVAEAFIDNPDNKPEVNHKDGNSLNNNDWNLEWNTHDENMKHATKNRLLDMKGEKHWKSILTEITVREIRSKYTPKKYTQQMLSTEYNVSKRQIRNIITGKQWGHIVYPPKKIPPPNDVF